MKKLLFVCLALVFVLAMFVPQAMAKGEKIEFCHLTDSVDIVQNEWTFVVGHVISVSVNAAPAHEGHCDFEFAPEFGIDEPSGLGPLTWGEVAENLGLGLGGVECAGFILDECF